MYIVCSEKNRLASLIFFQFIFEFSTAVISSCFELENNLLYTRYSRRLKRQIGHSVLKMNFVMACTFQFQFLNRAIDPVQDSLRTKIGNGIEIGGFY